MIETNKIIKEKLKIFADKNSADFVNFSKKIVVSQKEIIGVRVPDMRKIAKETVKNLSFEDLISVIDNCDKNIFEEVFVCGLMINYSKFSDEEKIKATKIYLEFVDSWALIDSAAVPGKSEKINKNLWAKFVEECLFSQKEFVVRFGIIFMLAHFVRENEIDWVLENLRKVKHDEYYVKMAAAWLYAEAARDFFDKTMSELMNEKIDTWIKNKAFQKMLESFRISSEKKETIRKLKNSD